MYFGSGKLAYGIAPFTSYTDGKLAVRVKDKLVGRISHRNEGWISATYAFQQPHLAGEAHFLMK